MYTSLMREQELQEMFDEYVHYVITKCRDNDLGTHLLALFQDDIFTAIEIIG